MRTRLGGDPSLREMERSNSMKRYTQDANLADSSQFAKQTRSPIQGANGQCGEVEVGNSENWRNEMYDQWLKKKDKQVVGE
ncbi:hypothetical protein Pmar_PMAR026354 [Perkinsus marinus ATCC 50983]|uniref:Uncharacterized protein n=1 Tax=Perkinsus marinus (strain ATCC 50983 / TXsc) TaxID=423536 RepID=C5LEI5_PERM5|nr:hypothetical protein Pmar_PMAR026354 [Perkinsus marinus ATCC 50983]EER04803.1 hypothetical protein Pmar_PMAR026354 [Perkinsus marinus ATCC 50983]|eukprot:XP_002772987.1 hypothetical protein Pmar_PMAR026354 [Perkinsus marinus ATCC 50983]